MRRSELNFSIDGLELSRNGIIPNGFFELRPGEGTAAGPTAFRSAQEPAGIEIVPGALALTRLKVGYQKGRLLGELGFRLSIKKFQLGLQTRAEWGEGFFAGDIDASFGPRVSQVGLFQIGRAHV